MRPIFLLATLFCAQIALAQPPDAPSTIAAPETAPFRGPVLPPAPPLITPEALQIALGGATTVTFSAQNAPLETIIQALLAGTDLQPSRAPQGEGNRSLSVDWKAKPFWSAAAELETLAGGVWDGRYGDGLAFNRFGEGAGVGLGGLIGAQGPLVTLVAGSVSRSSHRTRILGQKAPPAPRPDRDYGQIALTAYFDPKLRVQSTSLRDLRFRVKGDARVGVGDENRFGFPDQTRSNSPLTSLSLPLPTGVAPGTHFERISGVLHCVVVSKTESFNVPDILETKQISKQAGARTHTLLGTEVQGSQLTLRLSAATGEANPPRYAPFATNLFSTLRVRDGAGTELPRTGNSSTGTRPEGNFRFRIKTPRGEAIPGPYSLEWPLITEIRSLDVPFELRDIVVP